MHDRSCSRWSAAGRRSTPAHLEVTVYTRAAVLLLPQGASTC